MNRYNFKLIVTIFYLLIIQNYSFAQVIDYNQIILPLSAKNISIEEKLVQIAWNNLPENRILENNLEIQRTNIVLARWVWLDDLQFTSNLNEFVITGQNEILPAYYPRYNLQIRFRFGQFVSIPVNVKKQKTIYENESLKINKQKITLRTEVLIRYNEYKLSKDLLEIQTRLAEDTNTQFLIAEQEFKNGEITFEEYSSVLRQNYGEMSKKITSLSKYEISKIQLEELLGTKLEFIEGLN